VGKGKIERSVGYLRQSFWPLRTFTDLGDVNLQVRHWLEQVAHQRRHRETNQTPQERFQPEALRAVPAITPDYRDVAEALVHKDLRLSFDGNRYCVPPRYIGRNLTIKADSSSVTIYDQYREIVSYARCWQRGQNLGGERFQKELFAQLAAAQRSAAQQRLVALLGPACELYLRRLADTDRSIARQVRELLALVREYGPEAVAAALRKAHVPARLAPTISPTSFASNKRTASYSRRCASKILCLTSWLLIPCRCSTTTVLFSVPKFQKGLR
jgi:hypothetical protein